MKENQIQLAKLGNAETKSPYAFEAIPWTELCIRCQRGPRIWQTKENVSQLSKTIRGHRGPMLLFATGLVKICALFFNGAVIGVT